jgi:hypothetical protein
MGEDGGAVTGRRGGASERARGGTRAFGSTTEADYFHSVNVALKLSSASASYSNTLATEFMRFQLGDDEEM